MPFSDSATFRFGNRSNTPLQALTLLNDQQFFEFAGGLADRVRREVYTDARIFELEMERIHERIWIYCGHESQVPKPGDYWTLQVGRQPMIMVRGQDRKVHVLYNRCPHRGARLSMGWNLGDHVACWYHGVEVNGQGTVTSVPAAANIRMGFCWKR